MFADVCEVLCLCIKGEAVGVVLDVRHAWANPSVHTEDIGRVRPLPKHLLPPPPHTQTYRGQEKTL